MTDDAPVGARIRRLRRQQGMTQTELARRVEMTQPRVSQIEGAAADAPLTLRTLVDFANALGVTLADLGGAEAAADDGPRSDHDARASWSAPNELPAPLVDPIGRDADLAAAGALLTSSDVRLLTLTGPGGVGKTLLGLHLATNARAAFERIAFVSLAEFRDAGQVAAAIARAIGLRAADSSPLRDRLVAALRPAVWLLVLDNLEQAIAARPLLNHLLAACPRLTLLATSRRPLRLLAEHQYPVAPLALPDPARLRLGAGVAEAPAVRLFVRRAQTVLPDFALTAQNAAAVGEICLRLDGLPLATELAAARIDLFPPATMLARLDRRLDLPGDLPGSGPPDVTPRQRTLRSLVAWSYDLLEATEQALFRRLAVFASGFTVEAAEYVRGAEGDSDSVEALVDNSLVVMGEPADEGTRFAMLETIRAYAWEQLIDHGEADVARRRHAEWCADLAERAEPEIFERAGPRWVRLLEAEQDNIRAALVWAIAEGEGVIAARLTGALADYWYRQGQFIEGGHWLRQALALDTPPSRRRAKALIGAALLAHVQGDDDQGIAWGGEAADLMRAGGDRAGEAEALAILGIIAQNRGDYDRAIALHDSALRSFVAADDADWIGVEHQNLAIVALGRGDLNRSRTLAEQSLACSRIAGDTHTELRTLRLLGDVAHAKGETAEAATIYVDALARADGDRWDLADTISRVASVALAIGSAETATRLLARADALYWTLGVHVPPVDHPTYPATKAAARMALHPTAFADAWHLGNAMTVAEAVAAAEAVARRAIEETGDGG